jgi:hypothetical protein
MQMKFDLAYQRALFGNDIDVHIDAESGEIISGVNCTLDGFEIASDDLSQTPVVSFHRTFHQAGDAGSGQAHKLVAEVIGKPGEPNKYATRIWTDLT